MGAVYEAEQDHPRRTVALKLIKAGFASTDLLWRFELECEALGRLQHPGIAQIYEAGTSDTGDGPQPYFAMEFIRGQTLMEYADTHQLSTRERLEIVARVCEAVHHAHQRGLIHRDLKPGNILVDETGQPKVLDFGVARITDSDRQTTQRTGFGELVGTLAYMSPEQVLADPLELDTRSDVYSLGVILYELLSARLPLSPGRQMYEALEAIRDKEPAPLSSIDRNYRGDIETIAAKALDKDKSRRYSSAAELAADIQRYLRDEPIIARPPSATYQLQKFARRHKGLVGSVATIFVVLIAGVVTSAWLALAASRERDRALRAEAAAAIERDHATAAEATASHQRDVALRASRDAESAQHEVTIAKAEAVRDRDRSTWQSLARESLRLSSRHSDDELAALLARQAYLIHARTPDQPRYLVEEALQQAARLNPWSRTLSGHEGIVSSVAFSPDGNRLVTGSLDRTARVWDLNDPNAPPLVLAGHANSVNDVAFSPDGTRVVSGAHDQKVRVWDLRTPRAPLLSTTSPRPGPVFAAAFSPDGMLVGYADYSGVWVWNLQSPQTPPFLLKGPNLAANSTLPYVSMTFSPDGTHIAAGDLFGGVWLWDLKAPQQPRVLRSHPSRVNSVAFSPDGTRLASAGGAREDAFGPQRGRGFEPGTDQTPDWNIRIWDLTNPDLPPSMLTGQESQANKIAFSPDGKHLASAGGDGGLRLFDLSRPQLRPVYFHAHEGGARSVAYSPDGSRLATTGSDYGVRVWSLRDTGMPVAFPRRHQQRVDSIAISPDNRYLASGSADNTALLWNLRDITTPPARLQHEDVVRSLAFSPDSGRLATSSLVAWRVWNVKDPRAEPVVVNDPHGVQSVKFSADGTALATTTLTNPLVQNDLNKRGANVTLAQIPMVKRWNLDAVVTSPSTMLRDSRIINDLAAISSDWSQFVSPATDNSILVWNLRRQGQEPIRLVGHSSFLSGFGFSTRGHLLASAGHDLAVRVWDLLRPEKPRFVFRGSGFYVSFSMDDTRLVAGGIDAAEIRLWDLRESTSPPVVFRPGNAELRSVALSSDGAYLAIGDMDGNVWMYRLWSAAADYLCTRLSRNLSREEWRIHIGDSIPYERTCPDLPDVVGKPAFK
jgi:WD40 repeat protein